MAKNISGKIVDSKGFGIPNASVVVKNIDGTTYAGTVAAGDGTFVTQAPSDNPNFYTEISSIGYATEQFSPATKAMGEITLHMEGNILDAAVVVFKKIKKPKKNDIALAVSVIIFVLIVKKFFL